MLTEAALIEAHDDALRSKRTTFTLAEPVLRLHQPVIRPNEARLVARRGAQVWAEVADTVSSRVYGPHFEHLARQWTLLHASASTLGGVASRVAPTVLHRPPPGHEIDVVAIESRPGVADRVVAIGAAKWRRRPVGVPEPDRLRRLRESLPGGPSDVRLMLFGSSGLTPELLPAAGTDVESIDLERLYTGS